MSIVDNVHVNSITSNIYSHNLNKNACTISPSVPPYILHRYLPKERRVKCLLSGRNEKLSVCYFFIENIMNSDIVTLKTRAKI